MKNKEKFYEKYSIERINEELQYIEVSFIRNYLRDLITEDFKKHQEFKNNRGRVCF